MTRRAKSRGFALYLVLACTPVFAQVATKLDATAASENRHGTAPKPDPGAYEAKGPAYGGRAIVAAEFMGNTFWGQRSTFLAPKFIVLEIAVYPGKGKSVTTSAGQFKIRINGKRVFTSENPEFVASAVLNPEWDQPRLQPQLNVGGVLIGRPAPTSRFPDDPAGQSRLPPAQKPPVAPGAPSPEPEPLRDAVLYSALPEKATMDPVSGFVFFPYEGKLKAIRSLALLISENDGEPAVVKVR